MLCSCENHLKLRQLDTFDSDESLKHDDVTVERISLDAQTTQCSGLELSGQFTLEGSVRID